MSYLSYTKNLDNNLLMLLLRDSERYMPIVEFFDNVTHDLSELSWVEAELIAQQVSKANHSQFCSGIRQGVLDALEYLPAHVDKEKFKVAMDFAVKVNSDASIVTQEDIQTLLDVGWSEQTVEDIVAIVAIQNLYNIIATSLGFKGLPSSVFTDIGKDTVSKGGYAASFRAFIDSSEGLVMDS